MKSLISETFDSLKKKNKKALIPFLTANFPTRDAFLTLLHELPSHGAHLIEIGIPFSDPMADGKIIQQASKRAIQNGFSMAQCFDDIAEFKKKFPTIPVVIMTYTNPVLQYGPDAFSSACSANGADGLLLVDCPPGAEDHVFSATPSIDMIRLVTPTTSNDRLTAIKPMMSGFAYYVSVKGITGQKTPDLDSISTHVDAVKQQLKLPMVIGFGISNEHVANQMASISDGIIIGSAFLKPFLFAEPEKITTVIKEQLAFVANISHHINNG